MNYADRFLPSAVKTLVASELELTDTQTSAPITAFILVYMLASPVFGKLSDSGWASRPRLLAFGVRFVYFAFHIRDLFARLQGNSLSFRQVFVWSLATALTALARGYPLYLVSRMLVGVGEAAYGSISPSLIADFFPPHKRTQAMSIFYMCDTHGHLFDTSI